MNKNWFITSLDFARDINGGSIEATRYGNTTAGDTGYPAENLIDGNRFSRYKTDLLGNGGEYMQVIFDLGQSRTVNRIIVHRYPGGSFIHDEVDNLFYDTGSAWAQVSSKVDLGSPLSYTQAFSFTAVTSRYFMVRWNLHPGNGEPAEHGYIDACRVNITKSNYEFDGYASFQQVGMENYIRIPSNPSTIKIGTMGGNVIRNIDGVAIRSFVSSQGFKRSWGIQLNQADIKLWHFLEALIQNQDPIGILTHHIDYLEGFIDPTSIVTEEYRPAALVYGGNPGNVDRCDIQFTLIER